MSFKEKKQQTNESMTTDHTNIETDFDTPLNPRISAGIDVDLMNPSISEAFYTGDALNEHRQIEAANEFIADEELSQERDNL